MTLRTFFGGRSWLGGPRWPFVVLGIISAALTGICIGLMVAERVR